MRSPSLPPLHLMGGAYIATAMLEQSRVLLSEIYLWLMQFHSRLYHARLATPSPCPGLHPLLWPPHLCQYRGLAGETVGRLAVDKGHWGHSVWHCLEPDGYFQWRTCASPTKVKFVAHRLFYIMFTVQALPTREVHLSCSATCCWRLHPSEAKHRPHHKGL